MGRFGQSPSAIGAEAVVEQAQRRQPPQVRRSGQGPSACHADVVFSQVEFAEVAQVRRVGQRRGPLRALGLLLSPLLRVRMNGSW